MKNILIFWTHGKHTSLEFIDDANCLHPTMKFNLCVFLQNNKLSKRNGHVINNHIETELYTKPTDTHRYLLPSSCHHVTQSKIFQIV